MMMNTDNIYELHPVDGRKSFYGKAIVEEKPNGDRVLFSYMTPIILKKKNGDLIRLYDGWSATTGRHIAAFCGLNKKEFMALHYVNPTSRLFAVMNK